MPLVVEERGNTLRIRVRVKPRASKSRILGVRESDGILEVSVAAPPLDGEANSELIRTLASALGCAKSAFEIVSGPGSRSKLIAIVGFTAVELQVLLNSATGD